MTVVAPAQCHGDLDHPPAPCVHLTRSAALGAFLSDLSIPVDPGTPGADRGIPTDGFAAVPGTDTPEDGPLPEAPVVLTVQDAEAVAPSRSWVSGYAARLVSARVLGPFRGHLYLREVLPMWLGTMMASMCLALVYDYVLYKYAGPQFYIFIPPFGASCAVVFCSPHSPAAQPRCVMMGHLIGALAGLAFGNALSGIDGMVPVAAGLAIGVSAVMSHCLGVGHPPGCATAYVAASMAWSPTGEDRGMLFLVFPVVVGVLVIVGVGWVVNNITGDFSYPQYWL